MATSTPSARRSSGRKRRASEDGRKNSKRARTSPPPPSDPPSGADAEGQAGVGAGAPARPRRTRSRSRAQRPPAVGSGGAGARRQSTAQGISPSKYPRFMHNPIPDSPLHVPETLGNTTGVVGSTPTGPAAEPTTQGPVAGTASGEGADATRRGFKAAKVSVLEKDDSSIGSSLPSARPQPGPPDLDRRFSTDDEIIRGWNKMERIIARFVDMAFVDRLPAEAVHVDQLPYRALGNLSGEPMFMCRSPRYAKYMLQSWMWNFLDEWFFSNAGTAWACEGEDAATNEGSRTRGLASTMSKLTRDFMIRDDSTKSFYDRAMLMHWRRATANFIKIGIMDHAMCEQQVQEAVLSILQTYVGYFKPELSTGDAAAWDELVYRAEFVVAQAAILACKMRQSLFGVWLPFHPTPGSDALSDAVTVHQEKSVAMPPGQTGAVAGSTVTMTVVPGLVKLESKVVYVEGSNTGPGCKIVKSTMLRAKCFIDLEARVKGAYEP